MEWSLFLSICTSVRFDATGFDYRFLKRLQLHQSLNGCCMSSFSCIPCWATWFVFWFVAFLKFVGWLCSCLIAPLIMAEWQRPSINCSSSSCLLAGASHLCLFCSLKSCLTFSKSGPKQHPKFVSTWLAICWTPDADGPTMRASWHSAFDSFGVVL